MKSFIRLSVVTAAAAAVVFATGCSKRPLRPNPYQTVVGSQPDLSNTGAISVPGFDEGTLEARPTGDVLLDAKFDVVQPVLFAFDSAAIGVAERGKVQQAADYLKANPQANVVLVGRCDWRGTAEYNLGLGDRRGRAVMDYLGTLGVPASRVQVISKGDQDAVEGASADQMQQDRRVDFGFLD